MIVKPITIVDHQMPIALYSGAITLATAGQFKTLDPMRMQNPSNRPMLIDEIRFLPLSVVNGSLGNVPPEFGSYVYVRFTVGRQKITSDNFIPLWLLSPYINPYTNLAVAPNLSQYTYIYRPPVPVYVPKYSNLACDLIVDPTAVGVFQGGTSSITFIVVYVGREWDDNVVPRPNQIDVPWVSKYIPPTLFTEGLNGAAQISGANDLCAPFTQPLNCKSMIGRLLFNTGDALVTEADLVNQVGLRLTNAKGGIIIRDRAPFGTIFDPITRSLKLDCVVDQQSYFIATIDAQLRGVNDGNSYNILPSIALHGYRTVSYAEYMS